jgi:hypothetical protein
VKFYKFYFFLFFTLYLVYLFLEFKKKIFYRLPCLALFVTTDRQNHLIGPKIRVALLEDNGLEMQA